MVNKYFDIINEIILKDSKLRLPIKFAYQITSTNINQWFKSNWTDAILIRNLWMFELIVSTSESNDFELLKKLIYLNPCSVNLALAQNEWKVTPNNMNTFIWILQNNTGIKLAHIKAEINQEWFKQTENIALFNNLTKWRYLPSFELWLKHSEMVFPKIIIYKSILQNLELKLDKLSTNLALIELIRKSKFIPNHKLTFAMIEFDWESWKSNNKYDILEWIKYLVESFSSTDKLTINCTNEYESKCSDALRILTNNSKPIIKSIEWITKEDILGIKVSNFLSTIGLL